MHARTRTRAALSFATALGLAGALAACGGGSGDASSGPARAGAARPGAGRPPVTLGSGSLAEQIVLGELYAQALEAQGFTVALKQNIGSTTSAEAALRSGQIDLYPEYLGSFDRVVARVRDRPASVPAALAAARRYGAAHGLALLAPTPFADVGALAVLPDFARAHRLATIADLVAIPGLRIGAPPAFRTSRTGLAGLARVYGLAGVRYAPLTPGLQYRMLADGRIDAAAVLTTDGQLAGGDYVVLKDPQRLFGIANVAPVVRASVLRTEGPAFARTLDAVSAKLTTPAMQQLNADVTLHHQSPTEAAGAFLRENGLG